MMKHLFKFTRILAVAAAAVCMLGFSACNDEPYQHTNETAAKLEEELILTADSLQAQIDDLQAQIIAAACHCQIKTPEDVAKSSTTLCRTTGTSTRCRTSLTPSLATTY